MQTAKLLRKFEANGFAVVSTKRPCYSKSDKTVIIKA